MGPFKLKKSSLISALIISIGTIIFQFVFFLYFFEVPKPKIALMLCVEFFAILFLAYVILSLSFERFLVSRVKELYKSLIPTTSYINSINQDGTGNGYDMKLLDLIPNYIKVPIILSGGAGNFKHLQNGLLNKNINAVATANLFNFIGDGLINARKNLLLNKCNLVNWEN